MKCTYGWLKDHLETEAPLDRITEKLTALGLEVEAVEDRAAAFAPFFVARVERAEKHPDADRLKVCIVDTGKGKVQVVCGAPNARAGMKGVFAPEGSLIPGTGTILKKGVIRGQDSCGMLVSEREMGLSDDHDGIIEVDENVPVGMSFAALYGLEDPVIEIGLTPNRADCAGIRGIARDLAAADMGILRDLQDRVVDGTFPSPVRVHLDFDEKTKNACPHFIGRYVRGVKNGPSPQWMQTRLKAVGLRPISALVDITNYLSLDLCRPLHVYDADKLNGDIHVRLAKKGESFKALNDKTYGLDDFMTVICDDNDVLGLGGVIGGESTGCTDDTTNVFIESACFDPARIARTGRALQIDSDARYRFERGIDPVFTATGMDIATALVLELCGGETSNVVVAGAVPEWQRTIRHDPAYVRQLAGVDIADEDQRSILETLGFTISAGTAPWAVTPPSWRGDIEGRADLVEEIVRIHGYDRIAPVSLTKADAVTRSPETVHFTRGRKARTALAARGMDECITWSFMAADKARLFATGDARTEGALAVVNPISADLSQMRPGLLPNLIEAAGRNRDRGLADTALFEVGPVFLNQKTTGQSLAAGGVRVGHNGPRHWADKQAARPVDFMDAKADAFAVLTACGGPAESAQITRDAPGWYHPGQSATLRLGATVLACFGALHPALLDRFGLKDAAVGFEVFLDAIPQPKRKGGTAKPLLTLSPFQPVVRDFAFIVDSAVEADAIVRAARGADKTLIQSVELFDIYTGKGIEPGHKSVAVAITIQPHTQTLTDKELDVLSEKIVGQVTGKTGARLRA